MSDEVVELRMPLKAGYVAVLRATTGVIAGEMSFNYDEVMQLRVAVSEVFDIAIGIVAQRNGASEDGELVARFVAGSDQLEILITAPVDYTSYLHTQEGYESLGLLESLADKVEFEAFDSDKTLVRLAKRRAV